MYHASVFRLLALCLFLYSTFSISVSWWSPFTFVILLASVYLLDAQDPPPKKRLPFGSNPMKGKPRSPVLSDKREAEIALKISSFVLYENEENCEALERFLPIKQGTECIFAKKAKLWGSRDFDVHLTLEENVYRCGPMFLKFTLLCEELGLDGFVFLLPGDQFGVDPIVFGKGVRQVLKVLSDLDPAGVKCMDKLYVDKSGWVFEFNRVTMFVTTFGPCYSERHSRYGFGCRDCFILFQPEVSFAQHDLPDDTAHTNWDEPQTVRDRIRLAFHQAGRAYRIRDTVSYPMAHDIVKPWQEGEAVVEWWKE